MHRSRSTGKKKLDPKRPRRWQAILRRIPPRAEWRVAEIGVWMGRTAREILAARPLVTHIMVDAWKKPKEGSTYQQSPDGIAQNDQPYFDDCYRKTKSTVERYGDRAVIMRMWSHEAAEKIADESLDAVFIDAEHTYSGVKTDIELWWPKVKPGGWIGGHDYDNLPRFPGVRRAVDEAFPDGVEVDGDCTWFYRKGGA